MEHGSFQTLNGLTNRAIPSSIQMILELWWASLNRSYFHKVGPGLAILYFSFHPAGPSYYLSWSDGDLYKLLMAGRSLRQWFVWKLICSLHPAPPFKFNNSLSHQRVRCLSNWLLAQNMVWRNFKSKLG